MDRWPPLEEVFESQMVDDQAWRDAYDERREARGLPPYEAPGMWVGEMEEPLPREPQEMVDDLLLGFWLYKSEQGKWFVVFEGRPGAHPATREEIKLWLLLFQEWSRRRSSTD